MLDVRYSHLYFYQSLNRLQRGLSAIAELLVVIFTVRLLVMQRAVLRRPFCPSVRPSVKHVVMVKNWR